MLRIFLSIRPNFPWTISIPLSVDWGYLELKFSLISDYSGSIISVEPTGRPFLFIPLLSHLATRNGQNIGNV
jgi:hypothetical protein